MSGIELIQKIHPIHPELVIVFMTAYASIETAVTAIKAGAYDFLAKPFTPAELKNTIRKAATGILLRARARRLAEEKRQIRFQFITVLAHELKSPLNAVQGYLNIVKDRTAGDDAATYDRVLGQSLARIDGMKKLIGDLLEMTGIESGKKARELAPLEIGALAATAIETAAPSAAARAIAVTLDCPAPVRLHADPGEIEMILNNLVSNAIKYNRDSGKVTVSIQRNGDEVVIRVADTGIGLSADEAKRLFGEFVRIKNEKTRGILGTGLGLSIVAKIAALYRGAARVESEPGRGSVFTVTLSGPEEI
jgi:signal transduction histidine kinase